jgi:hypothetical protein
MAVQIRGRQVMDSTITAAKLVLTDSFNFASGTVAVATPSADSHAANKGYVDGLIQGLHPKESVRVLAGSNIAVSDAPAAIDGVTMASGDRVCLTAQSSGTENGIYKYNGAGSAMTRSSDADTFAKLQSAYFFVKEGTKADEGFVQTAELTSFAGQTYVQFSSAGNIVAGNGLAKSGNTLSVNVDGSSLEINSDSLRVKASGITDSMLAGSISNGKLSNSAITIAGASTSLGGSITADAIAGAISSSTITAAQLAGSIGNSKLSNSTVSFGGISVALGSSDATPAFDLSDATNYPTSSLTGTITNAQLAGSIANAKLANSSVSFGGISLALGSSDATPAFDLTDAINYPTSSLSGTITNAQLAGSIANAKLANSTISGVALGSALNAFSSDGSGGITLSSYNGSAAVNDIALDLNGLGTLSGAISAANDSICLIDASDSNKTRKKGIASLVDAIAGDGLNVASGVASVFADDASLEVNSENNKVQVKDLGITTAKIANAAVTLDKLSFSGKFESFTANGSTAGFDLAVAVDLDFKKFFAVAVNGLLMDYKDGASSKDQYSIANDGSGSVGKITFGANLDANDQVSIRYLA